MEKERVCCFTGHRPEGLPWGENEQDPLCLGLKALLAQELELTCQAGYRQFWCGMARGADLYFAEAVLACQGVHPDVELLAAVPCPNQTRGWSEAEVERYWHILRWVGSKRCHLVSPLWTRQCMRERNEYMVDRSSRIIAVYDGRSGGGTRYTLQYAMKKGLKSVVIDPETLKILK